MWAHCLPLHPLHLTEAEAIIFLLYLLHQVSLTPFYFHLCYQATWHKHLWARPAFQRLFLPLLYCRCWQLIHVSNLGSRDSLFHKLPYHTGERQGSLAQISHHKPCALAPCARQALHWGGLHTCPVARRTGTSFCLCLLFLVSTTPTAENPNIVEDEAPSIPHSLELTQVKGQTPLLCCGIWSWYWHAFIIYFSFPFVIVFQFVILHFSGRWFDKCLIYFHRV